MIVALSIMNLIFAGFNFVMAYFNLKNSRENFNIARNLNEIVKR